MCSDTSGSRLWFCRSLKRPKSVSLQTQRLSITQFVLVNFPWNFSGLSWMNFKPCKWWHLRLIPITCNDYKLVLYRFNSYWCYVLLVLYSLYDVDIKKNIYINNTYNEKKILLYIIHPYYGSFFRDNYCYLCTVIIFICVQLTNCTLHMSIAIEYLNISSSLIFSFQITSYKIYIKLVTW